MRRQTRWGANFLVFAGATFLCFLVVEGIVRLFFGPVHQYHFSVMGYRIRHKPADNVPYLLEPYGSFTEHWPSNPDGYFDRLSNGLFYRVNNVGFRGENLRRQHTGKLRVAFLGDSFCWGNGVKDEDLFTTRLERSLAERPLRPELGVEVLNFGLGGYNTVNEVALFDHLVLSFQSDVCVIWYFLNDIDTGGAGDLFSERFLHQCEWLDTYGGWSRIADRLVFAVHSRKATKEMIGTYCERHAHDGNDILVLARVLAHFADQCRGNAIVPVLAVHPVLFRLDKGYPFRAAHETVLTVAREQGIHAIDLLPDFVGHEARDLWVHPVDMHPNHVAHGIAAEAMDRELRALDQDVPLSRRYRREKP